MLYLKRSVLPRRRLCICVNAEATIIAGHFKKIHPGAAQVAHTTMLLPGRRANEGRGWGGLGGNGEP